MKTKKILTLLILIVIVLLAFALFKKFYNPKTDTESQQLSEKEISSLVNKVSKLILVPDEAPVIATIINAEQLIAEQKFYAGSQDGDYLIVFPVAKKALIYREKGDILVNVGPIVVDQPQETTKPEVKAVSTSTKETDN